jgi:hypothetical protein
LEEVILQVQLELIWHTQTQTQTQTHTNLEGGYSGGTAQTYPIQHALQRGQFFFKKTKPWRRLFWRYNSTISSTTGMPFMEVSAWLRSETAPSPHKRRTKKGRKKQIKVSAWFRNDTVMQRGGGGNELACPSENSSVSVHTHTHTHTHTCVCVCVCVRARARV